MVKIFEQCASGTAAMAYCIFFFGRGFGKTLVPALGHKYGVVTKSTLTARSSENTTLHLALKHHRSITLQQGDNSAETGFAVVNTLKIFQQQGSVGGGIMTLAGSIAGRVHTGRTAQGINLKAGIVGKTVISVMFLHPLSFQQGITLEGIGGFGNIIMTVYIGQRQYFISFTHYLPEFRQLM